MDNVMGSKNSPCHIKIPGSWHDTSIMIAYKCQPRINCFGCGSPSRCNARSMPGVTKIEIMAITTNGKSLTVPCIGHMQMKASPVPFSLTCTTQGQGSHIFVVRQILDSLRLARGRRSHRTTLVTGVPVDPLPGKTVVIHLYRSRVCFLLLKSIQLPSQGYELCNSPTPRSKTIPPFSFLLIDIIRFQHSRHNFKLYFQSGTFT